MMMMIKGGTAPLRVECRRWSGLERERRERVGNVTWDRWKMFNICCWSVRSRDEKTNGQTFFSPVKGITGF